MTPAVDARPLRRKTAALLFASASIVAAAALLQARAPGKAPRTTTTTTTTASCGGGTVANGGVTVDVRAQSCRILRGRGETHVAVEISAPASSGARVPVEMAIVLDRSGSMKKDGRMADAKAAALRAVDALGADDAFALVSFADQPEPLLPLRAASASHKAAARAAIEAMYGEGGTNISGGVATGADLLRATCTDCRDLARVERVVLISDGEPTEGIRDGEQLAALAGRIALGGPSITTVGVGLSFDDRIMTGMAIAGRGNYYFVEDTARLGAMFEQELRSLGETVAVDARLAVTPAPGVDVLDTYGYRLERTGGVVQVPIADLRAGEHRKVVLRLRVDASTPGALALVSTEVLWRQLDEHQQRVARVNVAVEVSDDAAQVAASRVDQAEALVQEAQLARAVEEAASAYEQGDRARAEQIVSAQAAAAATAGAAMGNRELEKKAAKMKTDVGGYFAEPPEAGGRGAKASRKAAYDLAR